MRVRALDSQGDYSFGHGPQDFLVDSVQLVQQKILTGLKLWRGEFFLNTAAGMPWNSSVLGFGTQQFYDSAIQRQILSTRGVTGIARYSSSFNPVTRNLAVKVQVLTKFGPLTLTIPFAAPLTGGYGVGGYAVNGYGV